MSYLYANTIKNWQERWATSWDTIVYQMQKQNKYAVYDDNHRLLTITYISDEFDYEKEIEGIKNNVGSVLSGQFFLHPDQKPKLTIIIKDKDGEILEQVEWPASSGYFSGEK